MSDTLTLPELERDTERRTRRQPPYHVVLINDDDHSYAYVILMLKELFGHPVEKGYKLADEVDKQLLTLVVGSDRKAFLDNLAVLASEMDKIEEKEPEKPARRLKVRKRA